jgi:indole-3-glycerol phosphate synthase
MSTYLDGIVASHRRSASDDPRSFNELFERAAAMAPTRSFVEALAAPGLSVIAEIKRRSPSKGLLREDLDVASTSRSYELGGAAAISVLTDLEFFGGTFEDLELVRSTVSLPVLRKDFVVDPRDLCDARLIGADAVLLIVAALSDEELTRFAALAASLCLGVLVEVHDEEELRRAVELESPIIGVNQRDLRSFEVDADRAFRLVDAIPAEVLAVAESGIRSSDDAASLAARGFDAILVGETFVRARNPEQEVAAMAGLPVADRRVARSP